jgi:2-dehydropantoate 2-reductase
MTRVLVVGAGAIGGYFGGRLLQAGRNVTFLVRERRAAELARSGLVIKSPTGDVTLRDPPVVKAGQLMQHADVILLSCKAYDLASAIDSFAPAVGQRTMILPLLNGMRHIDVLSERFGRSSVLGGQCMIGATLDAEHAVVQLNAAHTLTFGELAGGSSDRVARLKEVLDHAGFDAHLSEDIGQDMWEKWVFLATLAASTCLMRAPIGDMIAGAGGEEMVLALLEECRAIAESEGFAPRADFMQRSRSMLTTPGSLVHASMLRDIESRARIESDQIIADLLRRRRDDKSAHAASLLDVALVHLNAYDARRARTTAAAGG